MDALIHPWLDPWINQPDDWMDKYYAERCFQDASWCSGYNRHGRTYHDKADPLNSNPKFLSLGLLKSFIQHWLDLTDGIEYEHGPDPYTDPYEEAPGLVDEGIEIPQGYYISHLGTFRRLAVLPSDPLAAQRDLLSWFYGTELQERPINPLAEQPVISYYPDHLFGFTLGGMLLADYTLMPPPSAPNVTDPTDDIERELRRALKAERRAAAAAAAATAAASEQQQAEPASQAGAELPAGQQHVLPAAELPGVADITSPAGSDLQQPTVAAAGSPRGAPSEAAAAVPAAATELEVPTLHRENRRDKRHRKREKREKKKEKRARKEEKKREKKEKKRHRSRHSDAVVQPEPTGGHSGAAGAAVGPAEEQPAAAAATPTAAAKAAAGSDSTGRPSKRRADERGSSDSSQSQQRGLAEGVLGATAGVSGEVPLAQPSAAKSPGPNPASQARCTDQADAGMQEPAAVAEAAPAAAVAEPVSSTDRPRKKRKGGVGSPESSSQSQRSGSGNGVGAATARAAEGTSQPAAQPSESSPAQQPADASPRPASEGLQAQECVRSPSAAAAAAATPAGRSRSAAGGEAEAAPAAGQAAESPARSTGPAAKAMPNTPQGASALVYCADLAALQPELMPSSRTQPRTAERAAAAALMHMAAGLPVQQSSERIISPQRAGGSASPAAAAGSVRHAALAVPREHAEPAGADQPPVQSAEPNSSMDRSGRADAQDRWDGCWDGADGADMELLPATQALLMSPAFAPTEPLIQSDDPAQDRSPTPHTNSPGLAERSPQDHSPASAKDSVRAKRRRPAPRPVPHTDRARQDACTSQPTTSQSSGMQAKPVQEQVVKVPVKHVIMDPQPVHKAGGQVQGKAARMRQLMGAIEGSVEGSNKLPEVAAQAPVPAARPPKDSAEAEQASVPKVKAKRGKSTALKSPREPRLAWFTKTHKDLALRLLEHTDSVMEGDDSDEQTLFAKLQLVSEQDSGDVWKELLGHAKGRIAACESELQANISDLLQCTVPSIRSALVLSQEMVTKKHGVQFEGEDGTVDIHQYLKTNTSAKPVHVFTLLWTRYFSYSPACTKSSGDNPTDLLAPCYRAVMRLLLYCQTMHLLEILRVQTGPGEQTWLDRCADTVVGLYRALLTARAALHNIKKVESDVSLLKEVKDFCKQRGAQLNELFARVSSLLVSAPHTEKRRLKQEKEDTSEAQDREAAAAVKRPPSPGSVTGRPKGMSKGLLAAVQNPHGAGHRGPHKRTHAQPKMQMPVVGPEFLGINKAQKPHVPDAPATQTPGGSGRTRNTEGGLAGKRLDFGSLDEQEENGSQARDLLADVL